jgi:hypothetical protein
VPATVRRAVVLLFCLLTPSAVCSPTVYAYTFGSAVTVDPSTPQPVSVYTWDAINNGVVNHDPNRSSCYQTEYADQPVHAFYDDHNPPRVQLILGNGGDNHRMIGPTLDNVVPEQLAHSAYGYTDTRACDDPNTGQPFNNVILDYYRHVGNAAPAGQPPNCGAFPDTASNADRCQPSSYHNLEWLDSVWTPDGHTINALIHNEYHGEIYGGTQCSTGAPNPNCYYSSVTSAQSQDSGANYTHAQPPLHLTASLPYQYNLDPTSTVPDKGHVGYASPTNILNQGGALVTLFIARACKGTPSPCPDPNYVPAQQGGMCAMRTFDITKPNGWEAWGGSSYSVTLTNPYTYPYTPESVPPLANIDPPSRHVCVPLVGQGLFNYLVPRSLVFDRDTGHYILVGQLNQPTLGKPNGIYYSYNSSTEGNAGALWSDPQLIMQSPLDGTGFCSTPSTDEPPEAYPSIIDPTPPDSVSSVMGRNFETINDNDPVDLFFAQNKSCHNDGSSGNHRDLVKVKITFSGPH